EDGEAIESGVLSNDDADLAANGNQANGTRKTVTIPYTTPAAKVGAEYFLLLQYKLKADEVWESQGYVVGSEQFAMPKFDETEGKLVYMRDFENLTTENTTENVTITGTTEDEKAFSVQFDKATGLMTEFKADGKDLISKSPVGSFFRPETDQNAANVAYSHSVEAYNNWYNQGEGATVNAFAVEPGSKMTKVSVTSTLKNGSGYETEYLIHGNGTVVVSAKLSPSASAPNELGEVGMLLKTPGEFDNMTWYGRGPGETYWDRKANNTIGVWDTAVSSLQSPYLRLQEFGNKTDVRWLALRNESGAGLLTSMTYGVNYAGQPLEAVALHYMPGELSLAQTGGWANNIANGNKHQYQAEYDEDVVLRVLLHQKGVGNYDWSHNPPNAVITKNRTDLMSYTYTLRPLFEDSDPMAMSKEIIAEKPFVPMIEGIALGGEAIADFNQRTKSYDVPIASNQAFPVVSVSALDGVNVNIVQATPASPTAVIQLTLGEEEDSYFVNFVRDFDFVSDITLSGSPLASFNKTLREFPVQWPLNADLPTVVATAVDEGIDISIVQPTEDNLKAVITATNDFGDVQVYTINITIRQDFDTHRPVAWGGSIDIQTLPLGPVKYLGLSGGNNNNAYYYVNTPPTGANNRGDIPFVGLYPNRRITTDGQIPGNGTEGNVADSVVVDTTTGKKVYSHKNGYGSGGNAVGDSLVGVETANGANIAGDTLVMYAKFRPVNGSFALSFRDGNNEARNAGEVFKVAFVGSGTGNGSLRYSTTTSSGSNNAVGNNAMTEWAGDLDRDTYYEVWMMDTPNARGLNGHNVAAYVRYTNEDGEEITHEIALRQTTSNATTVQWPVFSLYEGNTSAQVYLEAFDVYTINPESPLFVYDITGEADMMKPAAGETNKLQLSASLLHSATDRIPVPYVDVNTKWALAGETTGVSISDNGEITLADNFPGTYFDVTASNTDEGSQWAPATVRINVFRVDEITVDQLEIVAGQPATVSVWVEGTGLDAVPVSISMLGKTVLVVNSDAKFIFTAEETAALAFGVYPVTIASNDVVVPITKYIAVTGKSLAIENGVAKAAFCVPAALECSVILAEYDAEGRLADITVKTFTTEEPTDNGFISGTLEHVVTEGNTVELFVWDKTFVPVY
ncbi:MAG: DUF4981 domain-containing protein, partial [Clostridiales bacterium]|nr:DUF4981 domain-containing protein [Clostridiales bacterium]